MYSPRQNHRGILATQACEACRARKRKCDEQRPKCALCRRLKIDCHYKDRTLNKADTMSDILTVLQQVSDGVNEILSANTVAHGYTFQEQSGLTGTLQQLTNS
ncbi:hypothetical protein J3E68DRAFT_128654 [Trichoderma sp. SZMC 28012]